MASNGPHPCSEYDEEFMGGQRAWEFQGAEFSPRGRAEFLHLATTGPDNSCIVGLSCASWEVSYPINSEDESSTPGLYPPDASRRAPKL